VNDIYSSPKNRLSRKDAKAIADTLHEIEANKGRLDTAETAEELVERSRAKTSPTHHLFEWNDSKAAVEYRLDQARFLIRAVYVVFEEQPDREPVRAFVTLTQEGKKGPVPMRRVLNSADLRAAMLEDAKRDALAWQHRYESLRGLVSIARVFKAMGALIKPRRSKRKAA
jgi:hypothetical protein